MNIFFKQATTDEHFELIIALQRQNLYSILDDTQKDEQAFVFVEHTTNLLKEMATYLPQMIAVSAGRVVGYNPALSPLMKGKMPELYYMFAAIDVSIYQGRPTAEYNQRETNTH